MAGEKRTQDQEETLLSQSTILVDIEGTTTSISFVKETLFPYVKENLKKYVDSKWEDEEFKKDLEKLKEQAKKDEEDKVDGFVSIAGATADEEKESLIKNVLWQMDGDRKTGALKQLQGHMWREAYNSGAVKGHVYEDVPTALESWTNGGRKVYVYSSGSVEAQKLLFGHSVSGDLLKHFSGYYDTEVGGKQEASSYKNIASKIGVEPSAVIFLTDVIKEARAAKEAGLSAVVVLREGNAPLTDEEKAEFTTIKSLLDLTFQISSKRQKLESATAEENGNKTTKVASEPMDTTEDVEMVDVSEKKTEKNESKEAVESNAKDKAESEAPPASAEEPMVTDAKEKQTENEAGKTEAQTSKSEVSKPVDTPETVQAATTDDAKSTSSTEKDSAVSEKPTDKPMEVEKVAASTPAETTDQVTVDTCKPKSKAEEATESSSNEAAKPDKSEVAKKTEEPKAQEKSTDKAEEKSESVKTEVSEKTSEKPAEKTSTTPEDEKPSSKVTSEPAKAEESSTDATKNGDVPVTDVEKVAAPTIPEPEAKDAPSSVATETKAESAPEAADVKSPKAKESETPAAENPESKVDGAKQESKEESVKNETVDEVKDKSTVDPDKKKLNGTTQNGDTEVPVSDDKLHSNGLNEGSSDEKLSSIKENTSAQNGEPESSSEASAESIKVKKVVDSTVTDGAGEPDVVPPVVVAATS